MIIDTISLLFAMLYVPVSLYFKKELKLQDFIIVFLSIAYVIKCFTAIYSALNNNQDIEFLTYILIGAIAVIWVSFEKISHIIKNNWWNIKVRFLLVTLLFLY